MDTLDASMGTPSSGGVADVEAAVRDIADPEIPVLTLGDLGIVREVRVDEAAGTAYVALTPTYSGCPATRMIEELVIHEIRRAGLTPTVETRLSPAWSTDWISERGRTRLREFGIAPPSATGPVSLRLSVKCPHCGSLDTREVAHFGSTSCKALFVCRGCSEPFDHFKAI